MTDYTSSGWGKISAAEAAEVTAEVLLQAADDLVWGIAVQTRSEEYGKRQAVEKLRRYALETVKPEGAPLPGVSKELIERAEEAASAE